MGLDIALGVIVLVAGIRGWFKGFVLQAIHIAALVGSVYLASPLRDLARPYAQEYFPGVATELLDRLLWWSGVVISYLVTAGVAVSTVKLYRRRHYLEGMERDRGDQGAGFLIGAAKGAVLATFLAAGIAQYAPRYIQAGGWMARQVSRSWSIQMTQLHHPAEQLWNSTPVQTIVSRVRREGLFTDSTPDERTTRNEPTQEAAPAPAAPPVPAALPPKTLAIPQPKLDPRSPRFLDEVDRAIERELEPASRR